jgi:DNA-binding NarL/FixJ family response regulator
MPGEDLATRVRVILIEHQINFRCLMAALLGQRPDPEVVAQAGSLTEARRRTTMLRFDLMVLDHVAALQALRLNQRGQDFFGFTGQWHRVKPPPIWIENN